MKNKQKIILTVGAPASGKGQPVDSIIPTPNGNKTIGSLSIGDLVFGSDGKPHKVNGVFKRGFLQTYNVSFSNGANLIVDGDHLWNFNGRKRRLKNKEDCRVNYTYSTKQLFEKISLVTPIHRCRKQKHIPLCEPLEYMDNNYEIDPYIIGIYLADGSINNGNIRITKGEQSVIDYIYSLPDGPQKYSKFGLNCAYHSYNGKIGIRFRNYLKKVGLSDKKSRNKFIPEEWQFKSINIRKRLLYGLMDNDGSISKKINSESKIPRYSTTSITLAKDVQKLVCSLGGEAIICNRNKKDYIWYEVKIYTNFNPFLVSKWEKVWSKPLSGRSHRFLESITAIDKKDIVCISVDSPDNLYISDTQFSLLTHNSTWAKQKIDSEPGKWKRVNKDLLREMLDNSKWSKSNEEFVKKVRDEIVRISLKNGYNVIVDDTNLDSSHKERMEQISWELGKAKGYDNLTEDLLKDPIADIEIKDFTDVPLEECIRRDLNRPNSVGSKVILQMYNKYIKKPFKMKEKIRGLESAYVCDIDGTIAFKGDRDIYDESKVYLDTVNEPVLNILQNIPSDKTIIFCSGRSEDCREVTTKWLNDNVIPKLKTNKWFILMRKSGDKRGDEIVKEELYHEFIEPKFNVEFVIDDRKKVKRMWVQLGLFVLDVNQKDEEF